MSPSSLPPPGRREHCPGELLLLSDRPTVPHGIERPRQLPGTICAPSAEREMSTPHPPAGSGTRTPTTRGRSPPLTARSSSKRKERFREPGDHFSREGVRERVVGLKRAPL